MPGTTTMELTETRVIRKEATAVLEKAEAMKITTQKTFHDASEFLKDIMTVKKKINDRFDPELKKLREATSGINKIKKELLEAPERAERMIKSALSDYKSRMDKIRREQEEKKLAKLREEAEARRKKEIEEAKKAKDAE